MKNRICKRVTAKASQIAKNRHIKQQKRQKRSSKARSGLSYSHPLSGLPYPGCQRFLALGSQQFWLWETGVEAGRGGLGARWAEAQHGPQPLTATGSVVGCRERGTPGTQARAHCAARCSYLPLTWLRTEHSRSQAALSPARPSLSSQR